MSSFLQDALKAIGLWLGLFLLFASSVRAQIGPYETTQTGAFNAGTSCAAGGFTRIITITDSFTITDLDVGFLASHSWRGDIRVDLSHAGTSVRIIESDVTVAANEDNYNIQLDDNAPGPINGTVHNTNDGLIAPPFENLVTPDNALSAFNGQDAIGDWTLSMCDDFPGADNGNFLRAELFFQTTPPPPPPDLSCGIAALRHDWDVNIWPAGSLSQIYTTSGETISWTLSGDTGALTIDPVSSSAVPITSTYDTGGLTPVENSLLLFSDFGAQSDAIDISVNVGTPGEGVNDLQFSIFDVDFSAGNFKDRVAITGSLGGVAVTPLLTRGIANTVSGNAAVGTATAGNATANGTLTVTFQSPVDSFIIDYGSATGGNVPANPGNQAVSIYDVLTCPRLQPDLSALKTNSLYDPANAGLYAVPGNDVIYALSVTNDGAGPTDADSLFLVDRMPLELSFFNGDIDGSGPESDPVTFEQIGASGLNFTYASDVAYSDAAMKPVSFAQCTYTPIAGYDPNVRYICFNPKGAFSAGVPSPQFTLKFRGRIN